MQTKEIIPVGWPCTLAECPPGFFIVPTWPGMLCFKSEYGKEVITPNRNSEVFNCAGEYLMTQDQETVQPVEMVTKDEEI